MQDVSLISIFLIPAALGLLGFVEPCTVGSHLLFLGTQNGRSARDKVVSVTVFILARAGVAGLFGAVIAALGQSLITLQTRMWLIFGAAYLVLGLLFVAGGAGFVKQRISLTPERWKSAVSPLTLGIAFGLNIPACAAPILFTLLGASAATCTILAGFSMMVVFGLFLTLPLVVFAAVPGLAVGLENTGTFLREKRWIIGLVFMLLGIWSIWFGLNVDPADWASL